MLLGVFASISEVLFGTVPGFTICPLEEDSPLEDLASHLVEDGFPTSASIALQYFQTKKQIGRNSNSTSKSLKAPATSPRTPSSVSKTSAYDNNVDYCGPNRMFGTIFASATVSLADTLVGLAWDLEDGGFTAKIKPHQSRESMTQVVIYDVGVPIANRGLTNNLCIGRKTAKNA